MVLNTPVIAYHGPLKAHSVGQFLQALLAIMSWPAATGVTFIVTAIVFAVLTYAPACLMSIEVIRQRPPLSDRRWLVVALVGWVALQAVATGLWPCSRCDLRRAILIYLRSALLLNAACLLTFERTPGIAAETTARHRSNRGVAASGSHRHAPNREACDT